jgi:hypothetical protein
MNRCQRFSVGAVYDRPRCHNCRIVGGHRPPLQGKNWYQSFRYRSLGHDSDSKPAFCGSGTIEFMKQHTVADGDCLTSIGAHYGFSVDTIWNLAGNASLKDKRKDPNTLVPGDVVVIPDRSEKVVACETAKTHRFVLSAASAIFRLQLFEDEKPIASQDFELKIGSTTYSGKTDDQGLMEVTIPCTASEGVLTVGPDKTQFELRFGHLQPVSEPQGLLSRLHNLGFHGAREEALCAFQKRFGLEVTGEADQATQDKLAEIHDTVCAFPE